MALNAQIKGDKLTITIDINNPPTPSKSGKTTVSSLRPTAINRLPPVMRASPLSWG